MVNRDTPYREDQLAKLDALGRRLAQREMGGARQPEVNLEREQSLVLEHARVLAACYDECLPDRDVGSAFYATLDETARDFVRQARETQDPVFARAVQDLRLLTQVDQLLIEAKLNQVRVTNVVEEKNRREIHASLKGVEVMEGVEASSAAWRFESTGVRLTVRYREPGTGEEVEVEARMDFHWRYGSTLQQAALDLEGTHISVAWNRSGLDYHRHQHLDRVIRSKEQIEQLSQGRWEQVKGALEQ